MKSVKITVTKKHLKEAIRDCAREGGGPSVMESCLIAKAFHDAGYTGRMGFSRFHGPPIFSVSKTAQALVKAFDFARCSDKNEVKRLFVALGRRLPLTFVAKEVEWENPAVISPLPEQP